LNVNADKQAIKARLDTSEIINRLCNF